MILAAIGPLATFVAFGAFGIGFGLGIAVFAYIQSLIGVAILALIFIGPKDQGNTGRLALQYAAWLAEIYRAGLQAIDKGQREAALSTGLSRSRAFAKVIWPQAWRIIIPPIANNFVGIVKDSSLVGIIGVNELMRQSQIAVSLSFRPFELYTAAMGIYIVVTLVIARFSSMLEQRAARSLSVHTRRVSRTARTLGTAA